MASSDFLAENNICGQNLLRVVSFGNAIIAELLRLADYIPPVFRGDPASTTGFNKYHEVIFDFDYFSQNRALYENKISSKADLLDVDEEFKENFIDILTRFYVAFEGIYKYVTDLNRYLEELEEGIYIQQTLETVFLTMEGKQLLCEALYLYGVMLLIVDSKIPGPVRERMLVSYYRYSSHDAATDSNIVDVCKLLRSTGFSTESGAKRPANYPESLFSRILIKPDFITMVIGRLKSDDLFNSSTYYPYPEHHSTAVAPQASMLYVVLFFDVRSLQVEHAKMREIVDKFFSDNWIINIYMGLTTNLVDAWQPYDSAFKAMTNTIESRTVSAVVKRHVDKINEVRPKLDQVLKEGVLRDDYVLDNINPLMNLIRDCNVYIRWLMLHTAKLGPGSDVNKRCIALREQVLAESKLQASAILVLLLSTAQLELRLRQILERLLAEKLDRWTAGKKECVDRMVELAEVFSGTKPLTRVERNDHLQAWFMEMSRHLGGLNHEDYIAAGRKIAQIIQALEEVTQFHNLETNMQVNQFLAETRKYLHQMLRTINIKDDHMTTLDRLSDLSYAWQLISDFTPLIQNEIKRNPHVVKRLRAVFIKLAAAIYRPLMRIEQAGSKDLEFVSKYYSNELVSYVRAVLQIIPESMFQIIERIIVIQTQRLRELPTRLDKDKLREFAQLDERHEIAKLTHDISTFADGMLMMKRTLLGIINVDPKKLLEDGIRKELVKLVSIAFHEALVFNPKIRPSELHSRLQALAVRMDGFQRSFEYLQDYVGIYGLKMYQEELSRIIGFNIELECNSFLRTKIQEWQSIYQSKSIPIPVFRPIGEDTQSVNFIGRLAREIIRVTDPKSAIYVEEMRTWYDYKTRLPVADPSLFQKMEKGVGVFCLAGLDRFMCFMLVRQLQTIFHHLETAIFKSGEVAAKKTSASVEQAARNLGEFAAFWNDYASSPQSTSVTPEGASRSYSQAASRLANEMAPLVDGIVKIGQLQLIRMQFQFQLYNTSRFESKLLAGALEALNETVLSEARKRPLPPESEFVSELATYLEATGMTDPLEKIYVTCRTYPRLPHLLAVCVGSLLTKFGFSSGAGVFISKRAASTSDATVDAQPFVVGCATVLRQLHPSCVEVFVKLLCHFAAASTTPAPIRRDIPAKGPILSQEAMLTLALVDEFANVSRLDRKILEDALPSYILSAYRTQLESTV